MDTSQLINVVLAVGALVLGIVAIWLSLYFYRRNNELYVSLNNIISRIEASSRVSETATKDVIRPIVEVIREIIQNATQNQIDSLSAGIVQRSVTRLEEALEDLNLPEPQRHEVREALNREISALLGTLKQRIVVTASAAQMGARRSDTGVADTQEARIPGSPSYDWMPFVRRIRDMEASNRFLSVRMLREKALADDPGAQEALQIAIDKGLLTTYYVDNPRNPRFPTKACRLNRDDPIIGALLEAMGEG